jgi:hypothetical protein
MILVTVSTALELALLAIEVLEEEPEFYRSLPPSASTEVLLFVTGYRITR